MISKSGSRDRGGSGIRRPLSLAVAQPPCAPHDVAANALAHAAAVRAARARVVAFPELSLTGYEPDADVVPTGSVALVPIVEACSATGAIALVGAPVRSPNGKAHIGMLRVDSAGAEVVYRKLHLGGREPERFSPGEAPAVLPVDGCRLGLAICKDISVEQHAADTAALGIDIYVAGLVHRPEELGMQDARGAAIARRHRVFVAFASFRRTDRRRVRPHRRLFSDLVPARHRPRAYRFRARGDGPRLDRLTHGRRAEGPTGGGRRTGAPFTLPAQQRSRQGRRPSQPA